MNRRGFVSSLLAAVAAVALDILPSFGNRETVSTDDIAMVTAMVNLSMLQPWRARRPARLQGLLRPRRGVAGVNRRGFLQTLLGAVAAVAIEVLPAFGNVDTLEPDPFNPHYGCITGTAIIFDRLWVMTTTGLYVATGPDELPPW